MIVLMPNGQTHLRNSIMDYEEIEKLSLIESKRQTKERKEDGLNMIRPFTFDEKKLLWDGLREKEKTTSEMLMEGFKEEQIIRKLEEDNESTDNRSN